MRNNSGNCSVSHLLKQSVRAHGTILWRKCILIQKNDFLRLPKQRFRVKSLDIFSLYFIVPAEQTRLPQRKWKLYDGKWWYCWSGRFTLVLIKPNALPSLYLQSWRDFDPHSCSLREICIIVIKQLWSFSIIIFQDVFYSALNPLGYLLINLL